MVFIEEEEEEEEEPLEEHRLAAVYQEVEVNPREEVGEDRLTIIHQLLIPNGCPVYHCHLDANPNVDTVFLSVGSTMVKVQDKQRR